MAEKIKAVGYTRFSSSNQREESISAQKRNIATFAQDNNMEVIDWYCDRAKSAKTANRPAFQKLIEDAKNNPKFSAIIVHKSDRFSRNVEDSIQYKRLFEDCGLDVIFVNERFDNSPSGKMMYHLLSSINQFYNDNLALEVMKGMKENAYQCKWSGGIPPLGYDVNEDKKLVINEEEAKIVRLIFQMSADGYGYGETIDRLNILGYKTKKGNPFGKNSLYDLIRNERYKGTFIFNKRSKADRNNKRNNHKYKPDDEIIRIENGCPAIVSESLWNRANAVKKATRCSYTNAKNPYLLTGLLYCSQCGAKLHGNSRTDKNGNIYHGYRCSGRTNKHNCELKEIGCNHLDSFVIDKFVQFFFDENNIPIITEQLNNQLKENASADSEYTEAKNNLKVLEKSRDNLVEAIIQTGTNETISSEIKEYEAKISSTKEFLKSYENKEINRIITEDEIRNQISKLKEYMQKPENLVKTKYVLSQYIDKINVSNENIEVIFKISMPPSNGGFSDFVTFRHNEYIRRKSLIKYDSQKEKSPDKKHRNIEKSLFFLENRSEWEFLTNPVTGKSHDCIYNRDFGGGPLQFLNKTLSFSSFSSSSESNWSLMVTGSSPEL